MSIHIPPHFCVSPFEDAVNYSPISLIIRTTTSIFPSVLLHIAYPAASKKDMEHQEQAIITMVVKCECCGLKEDCTEYYISQVRSAFQGKWLCGLCSEAVRDEAIRRNKFNKYYNNTEQQVLDSGGESDSTEDAVQAHMSFCGKSRSNPAIQVADGMKQMLRRMSPSTSPTAAGSKAAKKLARSVSMSSHYCF